MTEQLAPLIGSVETEIGNMAQIYRDFLAGNSKNAVSITASSRWIVISILWAVVVLGIIVILVILQINRALRQTIASLSEGAGHVAGAAGQISSSSQTLAQGSSEQAASLEETSASSEEINSMARRNSENSQSAAALVTQSQKKFAQTNRSLEEMVVAMNDINASSDKVAKIIKVIDEIAFQTKHSGAQCGSGGSAGRVKPAWVSQWWLVRSAIWRNAALRQPRTRRR